MKIKIDPAWTVDFPGEFFTGPFRLRLDLTEKQYSRWREWFYEELVKCDMWSCTEDDEYHAVQDMCGCSSLFETYQKIAEKLPGICKPGQDIFYPLFDPLMAYHLPGSGWINIEDGKDVPVKTDELKGWKKYFPKRSCVNCTGRYGDTSRKICSHDSEYEDCGDECFDKKFQSWCPLMNAFMEKKGWEVEKSLEKYAKAPELRVMPHELTEDEEILETPSGAPKIIQDFLKKANETTGDDDEHRQRSRYN